jgi:hypothetical protein
MAEIDLELTVANVRFQSGKNAKRTRVPAPGGRISRSSDRADADKPEIVMLREVTR